MSCQSRPSAEPVGSGSPGVCPQPGSLLELIGRHEVSSLLATVVDFSMMIIGVRVLALSSVVATVLGAATGAATNFTLGRHWTFRAYAHPPHGQALRYALVSFGSLVLNAGGEYLMNVVLCVHYVLARAIVATVVSLLWNFPMQRYFVFRD